MSTTPWTNNSTVPGWFSTQSTYIANNGGVNNGSLFSYGPPSPTANDRALGSQASNTQIPKFGWGLKNTTGQPVNSITVTFNGEQWRQGGNNTIQQLTFDYIVVPSGSTIAGTSAITATIGSTAVAALNFISPVVGASTAAPAAIVDGNAAGRIAGITATITLSPALADQQEILLRWNDANDNGNDHGLGIDDITVSFTTNSAPVLAAEPTVQPTVTATGLTASSVSFSLSGGNGAKRLVVVRPSAATAVAPADATTYAANTTFGTTTGTNPTTGSNNFVVVADATTSAVTVTGLTANTAYSVEAYAYNDNATPSQENYLTTGPGSATFTTLQPPVVTYVWNGTGTSFSAPTSWTPTRTTPAITDVLVFSTSQGTPAAPSSVALDFTSASQTVSQLRLSDGVAVTFSCSANRTLVLDGTAPGSDFVVDASSSLTLTNTTANVGLTISLATPATATIGGIISFDGNGPNSGRHSLISAAPNSNAIEFIAGSRFIATAQFDGSSNNAAFGTTTGSAGSPLSVIFRNGATYQQTGGSNPFATSPPIVSFEPTSRFVFDGTSGQPSLSGRTYGILEYNTISSGPASSPGSGLLTIQRDLIVTKGTVNFQLIGGIDIGGNIEVNGSASTLTFSPTSSTAAPVQLNGTSPQTIGGTAPVGSLNFGTNALLQINNPSGVSLNRPLTLNRELRLTAGLVTTSSAALLTLSETAAVSGGSNTSFVNGPVARLALGVVAPATLPLLFPVGKGAAYRPLSLNITAQSSSGTFVAEQFEGNASQNLTIGDPSGTDLKRVSARRYFTLTSGSPPPANFAGTVTLAFNTDDYVNNPNDAGLVVASRAESFDPWLNRGRTSATGPASTGPGGLPVGPGTVTSGTLTSTGFGLTGGFVLGATNESTSIFTSTNPLPVELTSFSAQRLSNNQVTIKWATASEKNSAFFEVQRSLNARDFTAVASAPARGTTSQATTYAALDKAAPTAPFYYRLRQVDRDGVAVFSPLISVAGTGLSAKVLLYPNPAGSTISFEGTSAASYRVLNQLGQVLLRGTSETGTATIAIDTLGPGLYFLELQPATGRTAQKFEKQ